MARVAHVVADTGAFLSAAPLQVPAGTGRDGGNRGRGGNRGSALTALPARTSRRTCTPCPRCWPRSATGRRAAAWPRCPASCTSAARGPTSCASVSTGAAQWAGAERAPAPWGGPAPCGLARPAPFLFRIFLRFPFFRRILLLFPFLPPRSDRLLQEDRGLPQPLGRRPAGARPHLPAAGRDRRPRRPPLGAPGEGRTQPPGMRTLCRDRALPTPRAPPPTQVRLSSTPRHPEAPLHLAGFHLLTKVRERDAALQGTALGKGNTAPQSSLAAGGEEPLFCIPPTA